MIISVTWSLCAISVVYWIQAVMKVGLREEPREEPREGPREGPRAWKKELKGAAWK